MIKIDDRITENFADMIAITMFNYAKENNLSLEELENNKEHYINAVNIVDRKLKKLTDIALDDNAELFDRSNNNYKLKELIINEVIYQTKLRNILKGNK